MSEQHESTHSHSGLEERPSRCLVPDATASSRHPARRIARLLDLLQNETCIPAPAAIRPDLDVEVSKRRVVVGEKSCGSYNLSSQLQDIVAHRFDAVVEDLVIFASEPDDSAGDAKRGRRPVGEQDGISVDVPRELEEHDGEQRVVALAFDVFDAGGGEKLGENGAGELPERRNQVEFEHRVPACYLLTLN